MFDATYNLQNVYLSDSITSLPDSIFAFSKIKTIILPETITTIPKYAFYYSDIETVVSEGQITEIQNYAFDGCKNLKTINIDNVKVLGDYALCYLTNMNITIPKSLISYGEYSLHNNLGGHISIQDGFKLSRNMYLYQYDFNDNNILPFLKSLPDMSGETTYTICISPTKAYPIYMSDKYDYYATIKNKRINTTGDELTWDEETGDMTVDEYVTSKNIKLT